MSIENPFTAPRSPIEKPRKEPSAEDSIAARVEALRARVEAQKQAVVDQEKATAEKAEQTKRDMAKEVADMVEGNKRLSADTEKFERADLHKFSPESNAHQLNKELNNLGQANGKLDVLEQELTALEADAGPEAVKELKADIETQRTELTKKQQELEQSKKIESEGVREQREVAQNPLGFALNQVVLAHAEAGDANFSNKQEELREAVQQELKVREQAAHEQEGVQRDEEDLRRTLEDIERINKVIEGTKLYLDSVDAEIDPWLAAKHAALEKVRPEVDALHQEFDEKSKKKGFLGFNERRVRAISERLAAIQKEVQDAGPQMDAKKFEEMYEQEKNFEAATKFVNRDLVMGKRARLPENNSVRTEFASAWEQFEGDVVQMIQRLAATKDKLRETGHFGNRKGVSAEMQEIIPRRMENR